MLNGIICVNKPEGFTSFDVIAKLRGILKMKKLGHSGTLDPMATGVLPVFAGSATKAISILPDTDKSYLAGFKLGIVTDTEDITGKILKECPVSVSKEEIEKIISIKSDEIQDNNNNDSTIYVVFTEKNKVIEVDRPSREITVSKFNICDFNEETGEGHIDITCSKGTYVRTLINDMGQKLGCGAVMTSLVRTKANGFSLDDCFTLEEIEKLRDENRLDSAIKSTEKLFLALPSLTLNSKKTQMYKNGVKLRLNELEGFDGKEQYRIYSAENVFLGIAKADTENNILRVLKNLSQESDV